MALGDLNKIFSTAGLCSFSADARISLGRPQFARHGRRCTVLARCAAVAPAAFPPAHCFGSGKIRFCVVVWLRRVLECLCCLAFELRLHCSLQVRWDSVLNVHPSALPRCFLMDFYLLLLPLFVFMRWMLPQRSETAARGLETQ